MIELSELRSAMKDYEDFTESFGLSTTKDAGKNLLKYLGVDPDLQDEMQDAYMGNNFLAASWLFGFSFALWYLNVKKNVTL